MKMKRIRKLLEVVYTGCLYYIFKIRLIHTETRTIFIFKRNKEYVIGRSNFCNIIFRSASPSYMGIYYGLGLDFENSYKTGKPHWVNFTTLPSYCNF